MNLINTINTLINKREFDAKTKQEIKEANEINKRANIVSIGQIQMRAISANGNAPTKVMQPMAQQRAKNLIEELGIKYLTELSANFSYPILDGTQSKWVEEMEEITESETSFKCLNLTPKRLGTYVEYSRDLVLNPSTNVAESIQEDLINSIYEKVQNTMFNDIYNSSEPSQINTYSDIIDFEFKASQNKISNGVYIVSPNAAKALKLMKNGDTPIYTNGMINGNRVIETPSLEGNAVIFGDFTKMLLAQWGSIDITYDDVTKASKGIIRLIANSYWNWGAIDSNAFVVAEMV